MTAPERLAADAVFAAECRLGKTPQELVSKWGPQWSIDTVKRARLAVLREGGNTAPSSLAAQAASVATAPSIADPDALSSQLLPLLKAHGNRASVADLADRMDVSPKRIRECVEHLRSQHKLVGLTDDEGTVEARPPLSRGRSSINTESFFGERIRFGVVSDTHLCSKYAREDVLQAIYDIFEREGIERVYHAGNFIDGEARFNQNDIHVHGMGNQVRYFAEHYPQRDGIHTYFIAGDDHEGWYTAREGVDIGRLAEDVANRTRDDLHYLSYMEHDIELKAEDGSAILRIQHPGGGSSYSTSYAPQKIVESLSGGEKPQILLIGHYHKAEYLNYRNVHIVQAGCVMDQSPFMRKKRLAAHVGGWIVEANQAQDGSINRFKTEWLHFFNSEFYTGNWRYQMEG